MSDRKKLFELAKKLGCVVDDSGKRVTVEAPEGMMFEQAGVTELVSSPWDDETKADMYRDAYDRLGGENLTPYAEGK